MTQDRILILDLGSQYTQLIARRIREIGVYSEVWRFDAPIEEIREFNPKGIILSGGPSSVYEKFSPTVNPEIFDLIYHRGNSQLDRVLPDQPVPVLGICYGMQLIVEHFGGKVEVSEAREYGKTRLYAVENRLFENMAYHDDYSVWMSHGDKVTKRPPGFNRIAYTESTEFAGIAKHPYYAIQFHPEVHHTESGKEILESFARGICGCMDYYKLSSFIDEQVKEIREKVSPDDVVLCGLSGGVDSSVAAAIVRKAIGDQQRCIFVDHGLLREGEREEVQKAFPGVIIADDSLSFLAALEGVTDPEQKRKIIGREFITTFKSAVTVIQHGRKCFLVQGTLYPDVIESESVFSELTDVIKSHHNVGGLPEELGFELIEPLRMMFKDEVRDVGRSLGLPVAIVERQPFPGPGLAIRCLGEVTKERLRAVRQADSILRFEVESYYDYIENRPWQYYAAILPVKSVGVMGDKRTYEETIVIRAVDSVDGMTADVHDLGHEMMCKIANRIVNEVSGVNRVVYDITSKPPGTVEWE